MDYASAANPPVQQHIQQSQPSPPNNGTPPSSTPSTSSTSTMPAADRPKGTGKPLPSKAKISPSSSSWASSKILTPSSAIIDKDMIAFLVTCISGWIESYSEEEKRGIIDTLPPAYRQYDVDAQGKLRCPITTDFVMGDRFLKRAVSRFNSDLKEGSYDPTWQARAHKAMQERQDGKFDDYVKRHVEEMFGEASASPQEATGDHSHASGDGEPDGQADVSSDGEWVESKARKTRATDKARADVSEEPGRNRLLEFRTD